MKYFPKEELEGRMVALVTNLKPAKMKGILSYGMEVNRAANGESQLLLRVTL